MRKKKVIIWLLTHDFEFYNEKHYKKYLKIKRKYLKK